MKPETPYQRLLRAARRWSSQALYPNMRSCWVYPKSRLNEGWSLSDLYERCTTAHTLGWDTRITATESGLEVSFVKRPDPLPPELA